MKKYLSSYPELAKEWHPTKNGKFSPKDFTYGSQKTVWWLCPKGHAYDRRIGERARKRNSVCPYCFGARVGDDNNLQAVFPKVAKEWHPNKNGDLTPKDFTYGSKYKAWWLCPKGHSYQSSIGERTRKGKPTGCSYCDGKKPSDENNLQVVFPDIAKEWHPTKNGNLTPKDFTNGSDKKVWWLCPKGHSYDAVIKNRTRAKSSCPFCTGKLPSKENSLQTLFPDIAKEWHPTKNDGLTPNGFTYGSKRKVWWLCSKGHSYKTTVNSRTNKSIKTGCPHCHPQSSEPEIRILTELKTMFEEVKSRYKVNGVEVDIFLPDLNVGIEFDGSYWHSNKEIKDLEKNKYLLSQDINLIRVRQSPLKSLSESDVLVGPVSIEKKDIDEILRKIIPFADKSTKEKIENYFSKSSFVNDELFNKFRSYFPSPFPENSLLKTHQEICNEWDYDKNFPLRPENFSYGARLKVWWLCNKGHSYEAFVYDRVRVKVKCPFCLGKKTLNYDLFK